MRDASRTQGPTMVAAHPRGAGFRVLSRMARSVADEAEGTARRSWDESDTAATPDSGVEGSIETSVDG